MTQAIDCPHCNQQIAINDSPQQQALIQTQTELEQVKKEPKLSSFIPGYQCKNGTCGQVHDNPRYANIPKGKCNNCDQFSGNSSGVCSWCKEKDSIEAIDKDELNDLGIRSPNW